MSLQLTYSKPSLNKDVKGDCFIQVQSTTEIQVRSLLLSGCVCKEPSENTLPFYVESIRTTPFYIRTDLAGVIALLSVFRDSSVEIHSGDKIKILKKQDLTKFI